MADYLNRDLDFDDVESDAELREDPIYQTNLKVNYLILTV